MSLAFHWEYSFRCSGFYKSGQQQKAGPLNLYSQYRVEVSFIPELDLTE